MNTQHTPGPWNCFSDGRIFAAEHGDVENMPFVGEAYVGYQTIASDTARANAKLMAAAPDLLAALENIVNSLSEADDEGMIEHAEQMVAARAAIAKAKGGAA